MKNTDRAILLNRISYSESSLIVTYYTFESGIQKFIFQGGKKKAHQLFPLSLSEITYYKRPDSDLGKLTSAECYQLLNEVPFNPIKSTIAFFIAEVLLKCLKTEESETVLFSFLEGEIIQLDRTTDYTYFPVLFLIKFSHYLGIYPHKSTDECVYFNLMEGIFTQVKPEGDIYYIGEAVELISTIIDDQQEFASKLSNSKKIREEALQIMIQYYQLHVPQFKELNSLEVIREILYS